MTPSARRVYPVLIDADGNVRTLDGVVVGDRETAARIIEGFERTKGKDGLLLADLPGRKAEVLRGPK